ncbi:MAG: hypothetical protein GAK41_00589 [Burkholderia gladioli]|nr:MAG: hypothetical protein GAK41_00589 [Burkholderia gladioli]
MSQIERNISVVVTGNSTGSANSPNAPPAAPVVATASLCRKLLGKSGGRAIIFSIGAPTTLVSFIVSDGLSSASFARRSVSRSSGDNVASMG